MNNSFKIIEKYENINLTTIKKNSKLKYYNLILNNDNTIDKKVLSKKFKQNKYLKFNNFIFNQLMENEKGEFTKNKEIINFNSINIKNDIAENKFIINYFCIIRNNKIIYDENNNSKNKLVILNSKNNSNIFNFQIINNLNRNNNSKKKIIINNIKFKIQNSNLLLNYLNLLENKLSNILNYNLTKIVNSFIVNKSIIYNFKNDLHTISLKNINYLNLIESNTIKNSQYQNQIMALNNQLQTYKGNVRLFCRIKPINNSNLSIFNIPDQGNNKKIIHLNLQNKLKSYYFDKIFENQNNSQNDIFEEILPFIQSSYDGNKTNIFCYGQTGSGKTYTIQGTKSNPGLLINILNYLINIKNEHEQIGLKFNININLIEIYNEKIKDLFNPSINDLKIILTNNIVEISNLNTFEIKNTENIDNIIQQVLLNRTVEKTLFNDESSRSHCIYKIIINRTDSNKNLIQGVLNIIDLAGNEKSSFNMSDKLNIEKQKKIQIEANFINKSLTTLGRILRLLKDYKKNNTTLNLPVRESKITRILQDCFNENSLTIMFINVCQEEENISQTKESLNLSSYLQ